MFLPTFKDSNCLTSVFIPSTTCEWSKAKPVNSSFTSDGTSTLMSMMPPNLSVNVVFVEPTSMPLSIDANSFQTLWWYQWMQWSSMQPSSSMGKSSSSPLKSTSIVSSAGAATDGGAVAADGADSSATGCGSTGLVDGKTGMSSSKTPSGTGFSNDSRGSTKGGATLGSFGITPANKGQTVWTSNWTPSRILNECPRITSRFPKESGFTGKTSTPPPVTYLIPKYTHNTNLWPFHGANKTGFENPIIPNGKEDGFWPALESLKRSSGVPLLFWSQNTSKVR